ncbi:MAG: hypothetical protein ACLURV_05805 [Gallintestinimicrobium sp.]
MCGYSTALNGWRITRRCTLHEGQLMEKMGYGGIEEQKKQHRMFVQRLEEFTDQV